MMMSRDNAIRKTLLNMHHTLSNKEECRYLMVLLTWSDKIKS
jgi:hypothetical protein